MSNAWDLKIANAGFIIYVLLFLKRGKNKWGFFSLKFVKHTVEKLNNKHTNAYTLIWHTVSHLPRFVLENYKWKLLQKS